VVDGGSSQVGELGFAEIVSSFDKAGLDALDDVLALRKGDRVLRHGLEHRDHAFQLWQRCEVGTMECFLLLRGGHMYQYKG
jgi:hypothetical protein